MLLPGGQDKGGDGPHATVLELVRSCDCAHSLCQAAMALNVQHHPSAEACAPPPPPAESCVLGVGILNNYLKDRKLAVPSNEIEGTALGGWGPHALPTPRLWSCQVPIWEPSALPVCCPAPPHSPPRGARVRNRTCPSPPPPTRVQHKEVKKEKEKTIIYMRSVKRD